MYQKQGQQFVLYKIFCAELKVEVKINNGDT